jgi:hypothetical protein
MTRPHCKHMVKGGSVGPRRQCKNRATADSPYCSRHVNHPERQIETAKASLTDYVSAAIRSLGRIVERGSSDEYGLGLVKDSDVIKAAIAILDRTGNGPTSTVTVQDSDDRINAILNARRRAAEDREA